MCKEKPQVQCPAQRSWVLPNSSRRRAGAPLFFFFCSYVGGGGLVGGGPGKQGGLQITTQLTKQDNPLGKSKSPCDSICKLPRKMEGQTGGEAFMEESVS